MTSKGRNRDIKNLFVVLGSSLICAALLSYFFISNYGPSGKYRAGYTLVDPSIIGQNKEREKVRFVFESIEFSFFDKKLGKSVTIPIQPEQYQLFYQKISSLLSLDPTPKLEQLFLQSYPTQLTTPLRSVEKEKESIFQVVEFIEENYFRVKLQGKGQDSWAYFYQPDLYREIFAIFLDEKR